ncbi:MAG: hypothetical protein HY918_01515 [Candidatus Doudnabacteria bacterium]|nr:hypothetical protein [Candidatus Doudnabacteria bacterium]
MCKKTKQNMSILKDKIEIGIEEAELGVEQSLSQMPPLLKWYFIIGIIAIIPAYFIAKNISFKIWQKNYAVYAVTAKPSFTNPKDLSVSDISVTSQGPNTFAALVKITNPNLDLSAQNINYRFNFYNSSKTLIYSSPTNNFFILPNQSKYLTATKFTSSDAIAYAEVKIDPNIAWQKRLQIPQVKLLTSVPSTYQQNSPAAFVVEGDFTNQSPYLLGQVKLTFVLYNTANKIIGVSERTEFTVSPFERRGYKQLWPNMAAPQLSKVEIIADTNTLDSGNLKILESSSSSASDLGRP